ncbi:MAG: hypothetical protein GYB38_04080 [Gammaproteobacteria bacterium]|nr:hypothetical protein [Gammaproteobacteria bacterium]
MLLKDRTTATYPQNPGKQSVNGKKKKLIFVVLTTVKSSNGGCTQLSRISVDKAVQQHVYTQVKPVYHAAAEKRNNKPPINHFESCGYNNYWLNGQIFSYLRRAVIF